MIQIAHKFSLHFNRVNMQRGNKNVWTVHTHGKCVQVTEVECTVPVRTVFKSQGRQPRATLQGFGVVIVKGGVALIVSGQVARDNE